MAFLGGIRLGGILEGLMAHGGWEWVKDRAKDAGDAFKKKMDPEQRFNWIRGLFFTGQLGTALMWMYRQACVMPHQNPDGSTNPGGLQLPDGSIVREDKFVSLWKVFEVDELPLVFQFIEDLPTHDDYREAREIVQMILHNPLTTTKDVLVERMEILWAQFRERAPRWADTAWKKMRPSLGQALAKAKDVDSKAVSKLNSFADRLNRKAKNL